MAGTDRYERTTPKVLQVIESRQWRPLLRKGSLLVGDDSFVLWLTCIVLRHG
jgi:hypothetical protein